MTYIYIVRL